MRVTKTVGDGFGKTKVVEVELNLHELDQMTGEDYKRHFHNPEFRKEVDRLEAERKQRYDNLVATRGGVAATEISNVGPQ
jgi:hypothetical protein